MKVLDGLDLASQQIKHVADGSASDDAATWGQVQSFLAGLAWKQSVVAASTANVTIATAPSGLDGVTLAATDRVLLKDQTDPTENGIYTYASTGSPLVRATDADTTADLNLATVLVGSEGTVNADTAWTQTTTDVTVGTDDIVFVQFGGGGGSYTAGDGLDLSGGEFSIKLPGSGVVGLIVDGTGVYIDTSVVVRKYAANVGDGSTTDIAVTHNLGTRDVTVSLRLAASAYSAVLTDWDATDANTVTLHFAAAPSSAQYRVTIHG